MSPVQITRLAPYDAAAFSLSGENDSAGVSAVIPGTPAKSAPTAPRSVMLMTRSPGRPARAWTQAPWGGERLSRGLPATKTSGIDITQAAKRWAPLITKTSGISVSEVEPVGATESPVILKLEPARPTVPSLRVGSCQNPAELVSVPAETVDTGAGDVRIKVSQPAPRSTAVDLPLVPGCNKLKYLPIVALKAPGKPNDDQWEGDEEGEGEQDQEAAPLPPQLAALLGPPPLRRRGRRRPDFL
mmetsp:Transcript_113296/g.353174  ORF Transcript_113296/g.353174 Transcript_113296/m.353174 type:complete len:243 (-) Transcript_113296:54-782(-)